MTQPFTPMTEGQKLLQDIVDGWIRKSVAQQEDAGK